MKFLKFCNFLKILNFYTSCEVYSGLCLFLSIVYSVFQRCPTRDEISFPVGQSNCKNGQNFQEFQNFTKFYKISKISGSKLSIFSHPGKITGYWIATRSFSISRPILARTNMGLDFVSDQYGCLFSRCRKYVINSMIHGHFHIGLVFFRGVKIWTVYFRSYWSYKIPLFELSM
jgi:hypothetical protein